MVFRITTSRGDGELQQFVPLFNLKKHIVWRGEHPNRFEQACWTIEVSTIEDLVKFMQQVKNPLVIEPPSQMLHGHDLPTVEIYNDYRE